MRDNAYLKSSGIALIEMIFAIMITLLLSVMASKMYAGLRSDDNSAAGMRRHLLLAQKISNILQDDIGRAGYVGCALLSDGFIVNSFQQYAITIENYLEVTPASLTLRYQSFPGAILILQDHKNNLLILDNNKKFAKNELLVISDCSHAEIFKVKSVYSKSEKQFITPDEPLRHDYNKYAEIGDLIVHRYYLDKTKHRSALMRANADGSKNQLADGVVRLSFENDSCGIFYRFDTDNKGGIKIWRGYAGNRVGCRE